LIQLAGSDNGGTAVSSPSWRHCLGCSWSPWIWHDRVQVGDLLERRHSRPNVHRRWRFSVDTSPLGWSNPAAPCHLSAHGRLVHWLCHLWCIGLLKSPPSIVTWLGCSVFRLFTIRGRRHCKESPRCLVVVDVLIVVWRWVCISVAFVLLYGLFLMLYGP
jgi:hypothetical protein